MTQIIINRNHADELTHMADDIQFYAELLRGIGYTRERLEKNFKATDVELFDNLLVHNHFNTTLEYSQYSGGKIVDCQHEQRRLAIKLKRAYINEMSPIFMKRAELPLDADNLMLTIADETNEYMEEYEIDECETMRFYANVIAEETSNNAPKPSSILRRKRTDEKSKINDVQRYLEILLDDLKIPMHQIAFSGIRGNRLEMIKASIISNECKTNEELAERFNTTPIVIERRWIRASYTLKEYTAHRFAERFKKLIDLPERVLEFNKFFGYSIKGSLSSPFYAEYLCEDYLKIHMKGDNACMKLREIAKHLQLESE